ncbi:MAG: aldo/keto reductase [Litorilinea sp.]
MQYRALGRTATKVSPLCIGTMLFGRTTPVDDAYAIVDRAIDAGINFFDTANVYGRGRSEEVTGEAFKRNGKRQEIVLATKVFNRMNDDDPNAYGSSRRHIIEQCEASLRRLQTDYIDLYQIHRPNSDTPIDETLRALDDLVRAGKVRYIGTSTFGAWQVMESLWVSKELGLNRFICEQPPYHILDRRVERELIPMAQTYGIGMIPWSPLAGGLLTGKYTRENPAPSDARYADTSSNPAWERRKTEGIYDVVEGLTPHVQEKGCTLSQFALAWVMNQPAVTSPIIGPRTMAQLEDNLAALDVDVTDADRSKVDELVPPGRMVSPFYEADFGPHKYRW